MTYENLENLTVSIRGSSTVAQVPLWLNEIAENGYAVIPVYHNVKKGENDIKSMIVRKALGKEYPTLYYVHATEENGQIWLVISNKTKVFTAKKWNYKVHVTEEVV